MINFNKPYNRTDFLHFLEHDFLPEDFLIKESSVTINDFTVRYATSATCLGACPSLDLEVFEITHSSNHDSRVGTAQDAFQLLLRKSYKNRALVVFVPEGSKQYRFSLLQIEALQNDQSARITRSYSNPRRYSFLLGEGAHIKTPEQFLLGKGRIKIKDGDYFNDLLERFSVEVLTKLFYKELSDWYFWALKQVEFPSKPTIVQATLENKPLEELIKEHNATNVIRMLTRILFVWFIKQKGLIPEELFDEYELENNILTELNPVKQKGFFSETGKESVFYKAILQNLFFASLNCPVKPQNDDEDKRERGFRRDANYGDDFGNDWLFRYRKYFKKPNAFVKLINSKVPFLNGGLFECLDDKTNKRYIDGFSDSMVKGERLIVPDYIFFGRDENVDLSDDYGEDTPQARQASVKGLINILKTYNFTVEENTPAEIEVALDPELLGKVFENLLASFNPETKTTARKQTGSFYTPREIVNYMVDESLIAYFKGKTTVEEENIRILFQYTDEKPNLTSTQIEELINALYECKILDPACGSGAFPMGVLQKLVHILQKVDPQNKMWEKVQKEKAEKELQLALDIEDKKDREIRLMEISNSFDVTRNTPDYARKLYLIENCIYGVDIQPIATQISKLRFFISLVVDQKNNLSDENFGIIPLPNLETKFVTANTLIGINRPTAQLSLSNTDEIKKLQDELRTCRHKLFSAKTKKTKQKYRLLDQEKRLAIATELKNNGWNDGDADKLANWDPYNQNAISPFFDPEWMFGLLRENQHLNSAEQAGYFDIVLGNPPYVVTTIADFPQYNWNTDLYKMFFEHSIKILNTNGICCFITPKFYLVNKNDKAMREFFLKEIDLILYALCSPFEAVVTENVITIFSLKKPISNSIEVCNYQDNMFVKVENVDKKYSLSNPFCEIIFGLTEEIIALLDKIKGNHKLLKDLSISKRGAEVSKNHLRSISEGVKMLIGQDVHRYSILWNSTFLNENHREVVRLNDMFALSNIYLRRVDNQLTATCSQEINFGYSKNIYGIKVNSNLHRYYILAFLNSKLLNFYYKNRFSTKKTDVFPEIQTYLFEQLPIVEINETDQQLIVTLVNQILSAKQENHQADTTNLENQIDILVYKLYDLTYDEVKVVDPAFALSEEEYNNIVIE